MAPPSSRQSALIPALVAYLETACAPYAEGGLTGAIAWSDAASVAAPALNPRGYVFKPQVELLQQTIGRFVNSRYTFTLSFRFATETISTANTLSDDWQRGLANILLRLSETGTTRTHQSIPLILFKGLTVRDLRPPQIRENADGGGQVILTLQFDWIDNGLTRG